MQRGSEAELELCYRVDECKPGADRAFRIVLVRLGIAKISKNAISRECRDHAAEPVNQLATALMVSSDHSAEVLWIHSRGEGRRSDQTTRHNRQLPTLGRLQFDDCYTRCIGCRAFS